MDFLRRSASVQTSLRCHVNNIDVSSDFSGATARMHWCGRWLLHRPCHLRFRATMVLVSMSYQTKHLSNSSRVFLLPALNPLARFLSFQTNAKKGDLYRWMVLSLYEAQMSALAILSQPRKRSVIQISESRPRHFALIRCSLN